MTERSKHVVVFSHGFGVDKTDRGLFTDIAASITAQSPNTECAMFDYCDVSIDGNLTVRPLSIQATMLAEKVAALRAHYAEPVIDLVCHSQGCVAAALAMQSVGLSGVRKTVFTTPPQFMAAAPMIAYFNARLGSNISTSQMTAIKHRNGASTFVPPEFWPDIDRIGDCLPIFSKVASSTELCIISTQNDEILGASNFAAVGPALWFNVAGDHNFTGNARNALAKFITQRLCVG